MRPAALLLTARKRSTTAAKICAPFACSGKSDPPDSARREASRYFSAPSQESLIGKGRPGGLETWTPFPFHTDLRFEENVFVSGPPPQDEPWKHKVLSGAKKRPACPPDAQQKPRHMARPDRNTRFRFRQNAAIHHVSDLSSYRGITVTDSQGFSPYSMRRISSRGQRDI